MKNFSVENSIDEIVVNDSSDIVVVSLRKTATIMLVFLDGGCLIGLDIQADDRSAVVQVDVILAKRNKPAVLA